MALPIAKVITMPMIKVMSMPMSTVTEIYTQFNAQKCTCNDNAMKNIVRLLFKRYFCNVTMTKLLF